MATQSVRSSCRMCHGVCQVLVHLEENRVKKITGDPDSLISRGFLCPKGAASPELLYHPERLTKPLRRVGARGENRWEEISWEKALDEMADRFSRIKRESGAEYVAITHGTRSTVYRVCRPFCQRLWDAQYFWSRILLFCPSGRSQRVLTWATADC